MECHRNLNLSCEVDANVASILDKITKRIRSGKCTANAKSPDCLSQYSRAYRILNINKSLSNSKSIIFGVYEYIFCFKHLRLSKVIISPRHKGLLSIIYYEEILLSRENNKDIK